MKMLMISCSEAIGTDVKEALKKIGVENYTEFAGVAGKGASSGPHLGDAVWPKLNKVILIAVEDAVAVKAIAEINELRKHLREEGVKAFVLPLEHVT